MIDAPSGGAPEKAPRWDILGTEGCGGVIRFSWCSWMFGGTWTYIGGRSTSVEKQGAHKGGGRAQGVGAPPASWPPRLFLDAHSKSHGSCLLRKSHSRRFHSIWTLFDIPFLRNPKIDKKNNNLGWASD